MTATLTTLRARVQQFLLANGAAAWNLETIDEFIRQALADYSDVYPRQVETLLQLPAAGREIALNTLPELVDVADVWWPYLPAADTWPPNRVTGFRLDWDDGFPLLTLHSDIGNEPQANDYLRLWYVTPQHLDSLDGASGTTLPLAHESLLVAGAAAYAANARAAAGDLPALAAWADNQAAAFRGRLQSIRLRASRRGPAWGQGWAMDEWDDQRLNAIADKDYRTHPR